MAERLVGNVDSVAPAGYLIPTSRGDARWTADRTPYGKSAEAVDVAAQSDFLKKALGAHAHEQLMKTRVARWTSSGCTSPSSTWRST